MGKAIALLDHGIRLFACQLYNHDYLWFSSYEVSKLSTTAAILHNYALTYSLGDLSYGISSGTAPNYEQDLASIPLYATPASAKFWSHTRITYNAINDLTMGTGRPRDINSPDLGWRNYLDPIYPIDNRAMQQLGFSCYLFSFNGQTPKGVTRLGKKGATIRVYWKEIEKSLALFSNETVRPTHPVNPLDISGKINSFEPVSIPPHLLLRIAEIQDDWFVFDGPHRVHIPKRVLERCQV